MRILWRCLLRPVVQSGRVGPVQVWLKVSGQIRAGLSNLGGALCPCLWHGGMTWGCAPMVGAKKAANMHIYNIYYVTICRREVSQVRWVFVQERDIDDCQWRFRHLRCTFGIISFIVAVSQVEAVTSLYPRV